MRYPTDSTVNTASSPMLAPSVSPASSSAESEGIGRAKPLARHMTTNPAEASVHLNMLRENADAPDLVQCASQRKNPRLMNSGARRADAIPSARGVKSTGRVLMVRFELLAPRPTERLGTFGNGSCTAVSVVRREEEWLCRCRRPLGGPSGCIFVKIKSCHPELTLTCAASLQATRRTPGHEGRSRTKHTNRNQDRLR